ncbi:MAG: hypothetical protein MUP33_11780, partial [Polaromonas sp.]|nr:hypothetical protein [Polaromonas sp.]
VNGCTAFGSFSATKPALKSLSKQSPPARAGELQTLDGFALLAQKMQRLCGQNFDQWQFLLWWATASHLF